MFNIFKIKIPKDNAQEVKELESWTVSWEIKTGWGGDTQRHYKSFVVYTEAKEFKKQLEESANFIQAWIRTEMYKN